MVERDGTPPVRRFDVGRIGGTPRLGRPAIAIAALVAALGATMLVPPRPLLVWNASPSAPIGLYGVTPPRHVTSGDMVIARLPIRWRELGAYRHYLPRNVPLVKRVAAANGDRVCAIGRRILVNGRLKAVRRAADSRGRPLPWWSGCARLGSRSVFLLTSDPASFDGRYFGPITGSNIVGKARLLWPAAAREVS